jgi:CarD family transcriptional regulator
LGTSCQKATPHEGNEINCVILVAALALAAYWSWDLRKMARLRFESEQLAMTCLLIRAGNGNEPAQEHHGVNRDMNFDRQSKSDCSDHAHAAADASQTNVSRSSETRFGFKATDLIVYPAHGVGQIIAIEEQTVAGASLEFFVIYFAKSKMTLRAPTRKAENSGMRKLSDPTAIQRMRRTLSQTPHKARGNWSQLAQEYESKINSGDIIAIAEVMRDLYRPTVNSGQSYSERQLYASALDRLSGEVALVNGITEEEAVKELESLVIAGAG